jgi:small basic protein
MSQVASQVVHRQTEIRGIYPLISLVMIAIIAVGFWESYFGLLLGQGVEKELFIHVHAFVYVSWMALFVTQTTFIATRRTALHRKLGQFGMIWGMVVLVVGVVTAVLRFGTMTAEGLVEPARQFVIWPLLDMVIFAGFLIPAIIYRRQPEIHKRLMVVATTNLIVAAVFRAVGPPISTMHLVFVLLWLSPIIIAMVHDFVRKRLVHPVYIVGVVVLGISSFRDIATSTDAWLAFTQWLASVSV